MALERFTIFVFGKVYLLHLRSQRLIILVFRALTMNRIALSAHLEVDQATDAQAILKTATLMLRKQFGVHETTIQIEDYQQESQNCYQCVPPT